MSVRSSSRSIRESASARSVVPPPQQAEPAPPVNPFAAYDARYWGRSEIQPANFATKGDLAFYQPKGDYQTAGNYAFSSDLTNFQTRGNYAFSSDLTNFQTRGNYAFSSDLTNFQTRGNYAFSSDLTNFQTRGNYAFSSDLTNFQTRGNYQLAGADLLASNGYFRTFGPRSAGGTVGNTNPDGAVGAVVGANIDNSWILHAPNDSRNTLFIAPGTKGTNWNWEKQMTIDKNGNIGISGNETLGGDLTVRGRNLLKEIDDLKVRVILTPPLLIGAFASPVVAVDARNLIGTNVGAAISSIGGFNAGNPPIYNAANSFKNMPYLSFDRLKNQSLNSSARSFNIEKNGGFTILMVFRATGTPGDWERIFDFASGLTTENIALYRGSGNSINTLNLDVKNGQSGVGGGGIKINQNVWYTLAVRYNAADGSIQMFLDQSLLSSSKVNAPITNKAINLRIGNSFGANYGSFDLACMYMYDKYFNDDDLKTLHRVVA